MHDSTTTVTVGLDVHARSIRLAAIRGDQLLEERTLPYDEEAVERLLRRWPAARCCYEAGPTGFGLYRHLVERGVDCLVVAPGLVPQRPGDRVKTDSRDARKLARLLAGGLLAPIHVPAPELEAARDLVRAREDARLDRMRDRHRLSKFCLRHGRTLPTSSWTVLRRKWLSEQRFEFPAQQQTFDSYVHTVDLVDARIEGLERAIRETAEQEPWCELVARLPARGRHADRARPGERDRRLQPLPKRRGVDGLRRARAHRALLRREAPPRVDHEGRQQPRAPAPGRSGLARAPTAEGRLRARPPPTRPRRRCGRAILALPAAPLPALAADGRTRETTAEDRRRLRARARRLRLGDRHRAAAQERLNRPDASRSRAADAPDHTENPRRLYAAPASGDPRP